MVNAGRPTRAMRCQSELQCQAFARTDVPRKKPHPARDDLVYTTHIVNGNELARAEIEVPHVAPHGCAERGFFDEAGFTVAGREKELRCRPPYTAFGWLNSTRFVSPIGCPENDTANEALSEHFVNLRSQAFSSEKIHIRCSAICSQRRRVLVAEHLMI